MNLELLRELCETPGPPGHEGPVREVVSRELEPLCDELILDPLGTLVGRKAGPGPRLMLSAHMDEIGFMITHITDEGFLRMLPLGGFDPKTLSAQRVVVHGREDLIGVLGCKPIHLMTMEERRKPPKLEDFYIDVGLAGDRVRELVRPGDVVTRERTLENLGDLITCKSLDNRAGLWVMIEAMRLLDGEQTECEILAAATVQEEVGLRGARVATARLRPHVGLAIDITLANDGPGAAGHEKVTEIGAGAAVKVYDAGSIVPPKVVEHLVGLAEDKGIPHQLEVMVRGSTDTKELMLSGDGAPSGCVSIPTRYVHQVVETCHPDDLTACAELVAEFCRSAQTLAPA